MKAKNLRLGHEGEKKAAKFLQKKGYELIKRNYRTSGIEIDIIARKNNILCFVEVKTRKSENFGFPEEYVDFKKIKKLILGAKLFSTKKTYEKSKIRFDVISIIYSNNKFKINHIKDAFEESD